MTKPDKNSKLVFSYFRKSPECYGRKLVDNGGVNVLVVLCVIGGEVAKSPLAENHREILLVGDLLEFSSNKLSRKLGEILVLISHLRMICPPPWPEAKEKSFAEQMNFLGLRPGGWAFNFWHQF